MLRKESPKNLETKGRERERGKICPDENLENGKWNVLMDFSINLQRSLTKLVESSRVS